MSLRNYLLKLDCQNASLLFFKTMIVGRRRLSIVPIFSEGHEFESRYNPSQR